ncbi:unnamed protein product [Allacma fusca]|uniref:Scavenger receptor class B member 1 n=1 Tax=Allacma fusca TaxID=39272 RepID=A0A8J2KN95_9HEXA|nr:unnamed protein product [Allacma fusca]
MERFPKGMIFSGAVLMGVTVALGWGGLGIIIRGEIGKQMRLINGTDTYTGWQHVVVPVYLSLYLFNLTNPDDVANGGKAVLKETGPYVYMEKLFKDADEDNVVNETLRYRQIRTYFFQPDMSKGTEDDIIVLINEPFLATAKLLKEMSKDSSVSQKAEEFLMEKGDKVTMARPVREWLFGEYSVQHYIDLANDTMITSVGDLRLYEEFEDGMFSAMDLMRKNSSDGGDGEWLIQTGRNVSEHFGKIVGWNGYDVLPYYKGDTCNALNGTDGSIYHPFITEMTPMHMFAPEMCRSVYFNKGESMEVHNVEAWRYHMEPNTLNGPEKNPDNWCFCPGEGACGPDGVHSIEACLDGFPRSVSLPHFMDADESVMKAVDGMMPDKEKHETFFDLHAMSGIVLKSSKRLQINHEVTPYDNFPSLSKLPKVSLPIFWMDETMDASHRDIAMLSIIKALEEGWATVRWGLIGISGVLVFIGVATALTRRSSIKVERVTLIQ